MVMAAPLYLMDILMYILVDILMDIGWVKSS